MTEYDHILAASLPPFPPLSYLQHTLWSWPQDVDILTRVLGLAFVLSPVISSLWFPFPRILWFCANFISGTSQINPSLLLQQLSETYVASQRQWVASTESTDLGLSLPPFRALPATRLIAKCAQKLEIESGHRLIGLTGLTGLTV
jgi:hypothetical protein